MTCELLREVFWNSDFSNIFLSNSAYISDFQIVLIILEI